MSKIILLSNTPNPENVVAMAAKLCYSPSDIEELKDKIESKDQEAFVLKLMKMGHLSPIEHISFTFAVEGVSRACTHQLVRHRLASYSQQSQRYVSEDNFDYIVPKSIIDAGIDYEMLFNNFMEEAQEFYTKLIDSGVPAEDARFVLPNAAETKIIVTMNARELLHFFKVRCCNRAQWEIRDIAEKMLYICKSIAPVIFRKSGPGCITGSCPEGEYTCGKAIEVRAKYEKG